MNNKEIEAKILEVYPNFKKVSVQLVGEDGNAFSIMGRTTRALKKGGYDKLVTVYTKLAMECDYDNLLWVTMCFSNDKDDNEENYEDVDDE